MVINKYSKSAIVEIKKKNFVEKASSIHGDKFDYTNTEFRLNNNKINIKCKKHNIEFYILPSVHLRKNSNGGCRMCFEENKRKSQDVFIEQARKIHGDKYDYSKVNYIAADKHIIIICKKHGEFLQRPKNHLEGQSCMQCVNDAKRKHNIEYKKYTGKQKEFWLKNMKTKYPNLKFSNFVNPELPCKVICKKHGIRYVSPHSMMRNDGVACKYCARNNSVKKDEYIMKAKAIHGDKYDYSKFDFSANPATFICKKHGEFKQNRRNHLSTKIPCSKCALENKQISKEEFLKRSKDKFGDMYDYSKVDYVDYKTPVEIICPTHGVFKKKPCDHAGNRNKKLKNSGGCIYCNSKAKFEIKALHILKRNKLKFIYQFTLKDYSFRWDFVIPDIRVCIEIDESSHCGSNLYRDKIKDLIMESNGYTTYRLSVKTSKEMKLFENRFKHLLNQIIKYKCDNILFKTFLDFARYLKLPGSAKPIEYKDYVFNAI